MAAKGVRRRTGAPLLRWSLGRQVGPRRGQAGVSLVQGTGVAGAELWCQGSGGLAAAQ